MVSGIISAVISYLFSQMDFSDFDGEVLLILKILTVGTLIGAFLLILCGRKFAAADPDVYPEKSASVQYFVSCLLLYASTALFGTCGLLSVLFLGLGATQVGIGTILNTSPAIPVIITLAVLGLVGIIVIRSTMRNADTIDAMGWDEDQVYKATSIWRILLALFLPLIIILVILLILGIAGVKTAADEWTCSCGTVNYGGNRCGFCHSRRGGLL